MNDVCFCETRLSKKSNFHFISSQHLLFLYRTQRLEFKMGAGRRNPDVGFRFCFLSLFYPNYYVLKSRESIAFFP